MRPSRAMITGELSWAWFALTFAWAGSGLWPFHGSYLHRVLDNADMDVVWSFLIGLPAGALMFFSAREWLAHCRQRTSGRPQWTMVQLDHSVRLRGWLCFALAFSWLYVIYIMLLTSPRSPLTMIAAGGVFFMLMFWVENRRVQRDIKKQTSAGFVVRT